MSERSFCADCKAKPETARLIALLEGSAINVKEVKCFGCGKRIRIFTVVEEL